MDGIPYLGGEEKLTPSHIYIDIKMFISLIRIANLYKSRDTLDTMDTFLLDNRIFVLYTRASECTRSTP